MTAEILSKEYAEALFSVTVEEGIRRSDCLAALRQVEECFRAEKRYLLLLSSPAIPAPSGSRRCGRLSEGFCRKRFCPFSAFL